MCAKRFPVWSHMLWWTTRKFNGGPYEGLVGRAGLGCRLRAISIKTVNAGIDLNKS